MEGLSIPEFLINMLKKFLHDKLRLIFHDFTIQKIAIGSKFQIKMRNLEFKEEALISALNIPLLIPEGRVSSISVKIPYLLTSGQMEIEVEGVFIRFKSIRERKHQDKKYQDSKSSQQGEDFKSKQLSEWFQKLLVNQVQKEGTSKWMDFLGPKITNFLNSIKFSLDSLTVVFQNQEDFEHPFAIMFRIEKILSYPANEKDEQQLKQKCSESNRIVLFERLSLSFYFVNYTKLSANEKERLKMLKKRSYLQMEANINERNYIVFPFSFNISVKILNPDYLNFWSKTSFEISLRLPRPIMCCICMEHIRLLSRFIASLSDLMTIKSNFHLRPKYDIATGIKLGVPKIRVLWFQYIVKATMESRERRFDPYYNARKKEKELLYMKCFKNRLIYSKRQKILKCPWIWLNEQQFEKNRYFQKKAKEALDLCRNFEYESNWQVINKLRDWVLLEIEIEKRRALKLGISSPLMLSDDDPEEERIIRERYKKIHLSPEEREQFYEFLSFGQFNKLAICMLGLPLFSSAEPFFDVEIEVAGIYLLYCEFKSTCTTRELAVEISQAHKSCYCTECRLRDEATSKNINQMQSMLTVIERRGSEASSDGHNFNFREGDDDLEANSENEEFNTREEEEDQELFFTRQLKKEIEEDGKQSDMKVELENMDALNIIYVAEIISLKARFRLLKNLDFFSTSPIRLGIVNLFDIDYLYASRSMEFAGDLQADEHDELMSMIDSFRLVHYGSTHPRYIFLRLRKQSKLRYFYAQQIQKSLIMNKQTYLLSMYSRPKSSDCSPISYLVKFLVQSGAFGLAAFLLKLENELNEDGSISSSCKLSKYKYFFSSLRNSDDVMELKKILKNALSKINSELNFDQATNFFIHISDTIDRIDEVIDKQRWGEFLMLAKRLVDVKIKRTFYPGFIKEYGIKILPELISDKFSLIMGKTPEIANECSQSIICSIYDKMQLLKSIWILEGETNYCIWLANSQSPDIKHSDSLFESKSKINIKSARIEPIISLTTLRKFVNHTVQLVSDIPNHKTEFNGDSYTKLRLLRSCILSMPLEHSIKKVALDYDGYPDLLLNVSLIRVTVYDNYLFLKQSHAIRIEVHNLSLRHRLLNPVDLNNLFADDISMSIRAKRVVRGSILIDKSGSSKSESLPRPYTKLRDCQVSTELGFDEAIIAFQRQKLDQETILNCRSQINISQSVIPTNPYLIDTQIDIVVSWIVVKLPEDNTMLAEVIACVNAAIPRDLRIVEDNVYKYKLRSLREDLEEVMNNIIRIDHFRNPSNNTNAKDHLQDVSECQHCQLVYRKCLLQFRLRIGELSCNIGTNKSGLIFRIPKEHSTSKGGLEIIITAPFIDISINEGIFRRFTEVYIKPVNTKEEKSQEEFQLFPYWKVIDPIALDQPIFKHLAWERIKRYREYLTLKLPSENALQSINLTKGDRNPTDVFLIFYEFTYYNKPFLKKLETEIQLISAEKIPIKSKSFCDTYYAKIDKFSVDLFDPQVVLYVISKVVNIFDSVNAFEYFMDVYENITLKALKELNTNLDVLHKKQNKEEPKNVELPQIELSGVIHDILKEFQELNINFELSELFFRKTILDPSQKTPVPIILTLNDLVLNTRTVQVVAGVNSQRLAALGRMSIELFSQRLEAGGVTFLNHLASGTLDIKVNFLIVRYLREPKFGHTLQVGIDQMEIAEKLGSNAVEAVVRYAPKNRVEVDVKLKHVKLQLTSQLISGLVKDFYLISQSLRYLVVMMMKATALMSPIGDTYVRNDCIEKLINKIESNLKRKKASSIEKVRFISTNSYEQIFPIVKVYVPSLSAILLQEKAKGGDPSEFMRFELLDFKIEIESSDYLLLKAGGIHMVPTNTSEIYSTLVSPMSNEKEYQVYFRIQEGGVVDIEFDPFKFIFLIRTIDEIVEFYDKIDTRACDLIRQIDSKYGLSSNEPGSESSFKIILRIKRSEISLPSGSFSPLYLKAFAETATIVIEPKSTISAVFPSSQDVKYTIEEDFVIDNTDIKYQQVGGVLVSGDVEDICAWISIEGEKKDAFVGNVQMLHLEVEVPNTPQGTLWKPLTELKIKASKGRIDSSIGHLMAMISYLTANSDEVSEYVHSDRRFYKRITLNFSFEKRSSVELGVLKTLK